MIYVLCEDSTSGYDFVKTIIERVIKPSREYIILSLGGSRTVFTMLEEWQKGNVCIQYRNNNKVIHYNLVRGDIVVLFGDMLTDNLSLLSNVAREVDKCGVALYIQHYYCFEAVFYSYDKFGTVYIGDTKLQRAFNLLKAMFNTGVFDLELLKRESGYTKTTKSVEQFADLLFSMYFRNLTCCAVSKTGYIPLDVALNRKDFQKGFYNNLCKCIKDPKDIQSELDRRCYVAAMRTGQCRVSKCAKGASANLRDFYNNSILSNALMRISFVASADKSLDAILK